MIVKIIAEYGTDREIIDACRVTVSKRALEKGIISKGTMKRLYMSEHSPIRIKSYLIEIEGIKSWIATHLSRHSIGCTPFIETQREDRNKAVIDRDSRGQGELVNMRWHLNSQAIINISRRRLCTMASIETREVWLEVLSELSILNPNLVECCVKECIYRGFCPEMESCGYTSRIAFSNHLMLYREVRK